ncbi:hypothetical protein HTV80_29670 [Streptomyces sp. Vc74B-19]|nr:MULTISPECIES: hypothetical protein [unclassified Streptomyces]MBT3167230.1 hypothetical protein [Streptomyces sp. Vc74B-19]MDU0300378.1 hypothetical protein [Streptomyces sp. PAL114]
MTDGTLRHAPAEVSSGPTSLTRTREGAHAEDTQLRALRALVRRLECT